jgi:hypothetical protein
MSRTHPSIRRTLTLTAGLAVCLAALVLVTGEAQAAAIGAAGAAGATGDQTRLRTQERDCLQDCCLQDPLRTRERTREQLQDREQLREREQIRERERIGTGGDGSGDGEPNPDPWRHRYQSMYRLLTGLGFTILLPL